MEKRKIEMMEMERAASSMGGPPPGRQQQHPRPPSPLGGHPPSHQGRHENPPQHHFDARDHDFEPPAPKRRATSSVAFGSSDHPDIFRNMLDCCVIYVDKQLRSYAESVQSVCVSAGLTADVQFISRDESLAGTLDNLSQKGIISAVILDELNEQRKTANVHLLHGTPRGEIQTGIAELPHWLRMHEEYNKYLIVSGKRNQSIRELLAELCGDAGRGDSPGLGGGNGMMNGPPPSLGPGDRDRERDRMPGGGGHHSRGGPSSMAPPSQPDSRSGRSSYMS
ncbi:uncharacterized protein LOC142338612 [Convolutriloba macropyga]|uniref:uncharacterized protein LOC142338612 n=1 Tax=Convolutriloba macropyga TaxID=536237 RepID=UPI003F51B8E5